MNLFKSLFFGKYKSTRSFNYDKEWINLSHERANGHFSLLALPASQAKGIIVLVHPMHKLGKQFFFDFGHIEFYKSLGYHLVVFDFNGFGKSDDNGFEFPEDIQDAIDKAREYFGAELPLGLHGISFGGSQIILAAINNQENIDGLLIESATSSNLDYYKGRSKNLFHLLNLYSALFPKKNEHNLFYNQIKKIKKTPILFIYGTKDVKTPLWMGKKLVKNTVTPTHEFVVFETKHLTTLQEEPEKYLQVVSKFWKKCLN